MFQGIHFQVVMVLPLSFLSLLLACPWTLLWTINNHNFWCSCIPPLDNTVIPPAPALPCPLSSLPFALLVGNVDWARPFHLDLNVNNPWCHWFTQFILLWSFSCTLLGPAHLTWTPSISLFALLLSNADFPEALLCFYLTQYWLSHFSTHQLKTSLPLWCCVCAVLITKSKPELGGWAFTPFLAFVNNLNSNYCPILGTGVISAHLCYCFTGQNAQGKASPRSWIATLATL